MMSGSSDVVMADDDDEDVYIFRGYTKYHFLRGLNDPASYCGNTTPETLKTNSEKVHKGYVHMFKGFDQKPDEKWCSRCRRLYEDGRFWPED